jgi:predicted nuclease of predicted toxin-antitoxin system
MSLAILLDEDNSHRVAEGLRQRGIDAISVHEIGRSRRGLSDEDQLAFATQQGRVLITYNRADYQLLDWTWRLERRSHAGILWAAERSIPRRAFGDLIRAIEYVARQRDSLAGICIPLGGR